MKTKTLLTALAAPLAIGGAAQAQSDGQYIFHLTEQQNNSDSRRSVTIYDTTDLATPLFSIFVGFEGGTNFEEVGPVTVDPVNGDIYVIGFDSGTAGVDGGGDTDGDLDIYKIKTREAIAFWEGSIQGTDPRTTAVAASGPIPAGPNSGTDYVTFSNGAFQFSHSNQVALPGVVEKVGEVARGPAPNFFTQSVSFIDPENLILIDDSDGIEDTLGTGFPPENPAEDHKFRLFTQVDPGPGAADDVSGFNRGTTESWQSSDQGVLNLDVDAGTLLPVGHSEPESQAYYADSATGIRGVWTTEADGGGDDITFFELDGSNNVIGTRGGFALDDSSFAAGGDNLGSADNIFVNPFDGSVIVVESGLGDATGPGGSDPEPGVVVYPVLTYDDGLGGLDVDFDNAFRVDLTPVKDDPTTGGSAAGGLFLERGSWTTYDYINNEVYFFSPDPGGALAFGLDIHVLNLDTGVTTSFTDVDESVAMFLTDAFGDITGFVTILNGDANGDAIVDLLDFDVLAGNFGATGVGDSARSADFNADGNVDLLDFDLLAGNFGVSDVPATAGAVPEPASLALLALGGLAAMRRRRA
ncbi:MAG: PEP-CTERM sorting domain-containing protein [Planctomycetota bacterium]